MKRVIVYFLLFSLITMSFTYDIYAEGSNPDSLSQKKIMIYLKPDVTVKFNDVKLVFRNLEGIAVYPIIYNGSTYLPVRAISGLMNEPIEWDGASKTVFIGKTLSDPSKLTAEVSLNQTDTSANVNNNYLKAELVSAYQKPNVLVMYDFVLQTFTDVNGNQIYPIIYNGTTYLPIRAISELMNEPIEWDGSSKTVTIGDGEDTTQDNNAEEEENESSLAAKDLKSLFEREEVLYYEATARTTSLKETVTLDEKQLIASVISENYISAQKLTVEIKAMDTSDFTEAEKDAYDKVAAFTESTEYYILVLENIAYLAAQDTDYSMLAETFLYFAMDSQTKMEEARTLVEALNQVN